MFYTLGGYGLFVLCFLRIWLSTVVKFEVVIFALYYLVFAIIIVLTECGYKKLQEKFHFLGYLWGKGFFCFFIGSLAFVGFESMFIRGIVGLYFGITGLILLFMSLIARECCIKTDEAATDEEKQPLKKDDS